jgi:hypothetical protein
MNRKQAETLLKTARANVCALPVMQVPQPVFDRAAFVAALGEDKKSDTINALLDFASSEGALAGIPAGVNRYVDEWRQRRAERAVAA